MATSDYDLEQKDQEIKAEENVGVGKIIGKVGGAYPLIFINSYAFNGKEIASMDLKCEGILPELILVLNLSSGRFISKDYPKDGDKVNIFIRSMNSQFKPVRCDFLIKNVFSSKSDDSEGNFIRFTITADLDIEGFFKEQDFYVIKDLTSFEALNQLCKEQGLGFVTNETKTDDKMTWRCSKESYFDLLKVIRAHAYKDEDSFFDLWIDYYYNINFVNLNKLYSASDGVAVPDGLVQSDFQYDWNVIDKNSGDKFIKSRMNLNNLETSTNTNYHIESYELNNKAGKVVEKNAYHKDVYFYDRITNGLENLSLYPLKTEKSNLNKNPMLGRANDDTYLTKKTTEYLGIQSSEKDGNVHKFWMLSERQNKINIDESQKITLVVHLKKSNFNLYRGLIIPVYIYVSNDEYRVQVAGNKGDDVDNNEGTLDRFLSGNYVIIGVDFCWKGSDEVLNSIDYLGEWDQKITLSRREWTEPNSDYYHLSSNKIYQS